MNKFLTIEEQIKKDEEVNADKDNQNKGDVLGVIGGDVLAEVSPERN